MVGSVSARFYMIRSIHLGSRCTLCNDGRAALRRCARRLGVCISGARRQHPGEVEQRLRGGRRRLLAEVVAAALQRGRQLRIDRNACCGVVTYEVCSEERDCLANESVGSGSGRPCAVLPRKGTANSLAMASPPPDEKTLVHSCWP